MNKFEKDLEDAEKAFYMQMLPYKNEKDERGIIITIVVEYSSYNKEINFVFHSSSSTLKHGLFLLKKDGFKQLSDYFAKSTQQFVPSSTLKENLIQIPVNYTLFNSFLNYFEKNKNWQVEWITKWELRKVFENQQDLLLNIESKSIPDDEIHNFLNSHEKSLMQHFKNCL